MKALGDHISRDDYHMKSPKPEEPIAEVKPEAEAKQGDVNTKAIIKEALLKAIERKNRLVSLSLLLDLWDSSSDIIITSKAMLYN